MSKMARITIMFTVSLCITGNAFQLRSLSTKAWPSFRRDQKGSMSRHNILYMSGSNANEIVPLKKGSICALVTPMTSTGDVDLENLRSLLRFHVDNGTDGLCILGTTGEASVMDMGERKTILQTAVEEVKGKMPIVAGTGSIDPVHVKEMTLQAMDLGCDAALIVTPYYVKPPQRCLLKHFLTMADLGLPILMYNVPGRTRSDLTVETVAMCADHQNIIGIKDATGDISRVSSTRKVTGDDFLLFSGDDATDAEFVLQGGDGCVSVTANVAPKTKHDLMMAALSGDKAEVNRIGKPLKALDELLFIESNPIPTKWALKRMGMINTAFCRPPLDQLDSAFYNQIEESLRNAELL